MKLVSFNINGIRARPHQIARLIDSHQPDLIGLQEIKVQDQEFPEEMIRELGYHPYYFGQKSHYGVALLTREPLLDVQRGFPGDPEDAQRRMIIGKLQGYSATRRKERPGTPRQDERNGREGLAYYRRSLCSGLGRRGRLRSLRLRPFHRRAVLRPQCLHLLRVRLLQRQTCASQRTPC